MVEAIEIFPLITHGGRRSGWLLRDNLGIIMFLMGQQMSLATTACREDLVTTSDSASERFLTGVGAHMLLERGFLVPSLPTSTVFTDKWLLSSMNSVMDQ